MQESIEAVELTEDLVLTRTRAPDLESVKKLNCWASHINDVQVVRRMPNLEVCSLSINQILSLRDFAHCHKLKELYVRTNNIQRLEDIHYLKNLPKLRSLWLSENPCANTQNYRSTVLRSLPNLQKLDNRVVTPEEIEAAKVEGDDIAVPEDFSFSSVFTSSFNDTQSSISSSLEYSAYPRKKREQRRQKITAQLEAIRKSQEEDSSNSGRSEEDQSACEKSDPDSKSYNDSDTEWQDRNVLKCENVSESFLSVASSTGEDGIVRVVIDCERIKQQMSDECDTEVGIDEKIETNGQSSNIITVHSNEDFKNLNDGVQPEENNNNNNNNNKTSEVACGAKEEKIEISIGSQSIDESQNHNPVNVKNSNKMPYNPLLDKIRLDDSLNCALSQDSVYSIALDDLVIELGDSDMKSIIKETEEENIVDTSLASETISVKGAEDLPPVTMSTQNQFDKEEKIKESEEQERNEERKNGLLDWEEHNRLRAELGVKQMERTTTPKTSHTDVTRLRNANILQAVLSLVKELDKDSLDLVSSAVQSRLETL